MKTDILFKVSRPLSDVISQYVRTQAIHREKGVREDSFGSKEDAIEYIFSYLNIDLKKIYLVSRFEMDMPRNKGEYIQIYVGSGEALIESMKYSEKVSVGITDPVSGMIYEVFIEESEEIDGFDTSLEIYPSSRVAGRV